MKRKLFQLLSVATLLLAFTMCTKQDEVEIQVESLKLSSNSLTLPKGETAKLEAGVMPANATNYVVRWYVGDNTIATVSDDGEITALTEGETTIIAKCGIATATCLLNVSSLNIPLKNIEFAEKSIEVIVGSSTELAVKIIPENTTDQISWSSSDESIATVLGGTVIAKRQGEVVITAMGGGQKATIIVKVVEPKVEVTSLKLAEKNVSIETGESKTLDVDVESNAPEKVKLTWSSSNDKIAAVKNGRVTGVSTGTAQITVSYGEIKDQCTVEVTEKAVIVNSLSLDKTEATIMENQTLKLQAMVDPEELIKDLKWSSKDEKVATVSQYGEVKAIAKGETTITVSVGDKSAKCVITVEKALTEKDFVINVTKTTPINVEFTVTPSSPDNYYTWGILSKKAYDEIITRFGSKYKADLSWWEYGGDGAFLADISKDKISSDYLASSNIGMPGSEVVIYCYGVNKDTKEKTSPIITKTVTLPQSISSANKLNFVFDKVIDTGILGKITTTNQDGYYITLQKKSYVDSYREKKKEGTLVDGQDAVLYMFSQCIAGDLKYASVEEIMRRGDLDITAETFPDKKKNREYVLMFIGFDKEKGFCNEPQFIEFKTGGDLLNK